MLPVTSVAISSDLKYVVTGSRDNYVILYSLINIKNLVVSGETLFKFNLGLGNVASKVGFSPDNSKIVAATSDGNANVFDVQSGALMYVLKGHKGPIWSMSMQDIDTEVQNSIKTNSTLTDRQI